MTAQVRPLNHLELEQPRVCDMCRHAVGVRFVDYDIWACLQCAHRYLVHLEVKG